MRAIFIDPMNRTVGGIDISPATDLSDLIKDYIEIAVAYDNGDTLYVGENGLFGASDALMGRTDAFRAYFFDVGAHQPFAGYGVLVGAEDEHGRLTDVKTSIEVLRRTVRFIAPIADQGDGNKH